ncbi:nicotinate-nucleotide adenylyltransferase [Elusimicrobium posterum]|uniref:bis(5'-nucleosyl)-tetraphosphatase (symmetrical) YqeK n=1 Tax=Elusimicrobium posterum TaxID=3116653 RepID=UPI003C7292A4
MKVLYFGGSFDPAHKAHRTLLKAAVAELRPDAVHIVPAYHSPFKTKSPTPFNLRMQSAKIMFKGIKANIIFDNFEQKQKKKTYAWEVVKYLKETYKNPQIFMLTGTDTLNTIMSWKNPDYLLKNITVVTGKRIGIAIEKLPFKYIELKARIPKISSTFLRLDTMINGVPSPHMGKEIAQLAEENDLYALGIHKWLKENLKENRYLHSKAVAHLAYCLAYINDVNPDDCVIAALLHDAGKSMSSEQLVDYCVKNKIKPPFFKEICMYSPDLLHSYVSAHIAKTIFKIKNQDIIEAVKHHTLGAVNMPLFAKILFVADIASKDRKYPGAMTIRTTAHKDINAAMKMAAATKLTFTIKSGKWLCPEGIYLWNDLAVKQNF